jgi:hypothetical protein
LGSVPKNEKQFESNLSNNNYPNKTSVQSFDSYNNRDDNFKQKFTTSEKSIIKPNYFGNDLKVEKKPKSVKPIPVVEKPKLGDVLPSQCQPPISYNNKFSSSLTILDTLSYTLSSLFKISFCGGVSTDF